MSVIHLAVAARGSGVPSSRGSPLTGSKSCKGRQVGGWVHVSCLGRRGCMCAAWTGMGAYVLHGQAWVHVCCLDRRGCMYAAWTGMGALLTYRQA